MCKLSKRHTLRRKHTDNRRLHKQIVEHGGGFLQYLDSKTMATHIIASTLPPKKSVEFNRYRIVKPAWITDSVEGGKLMPWNDYRVLDEGPRQKVLKFGGSAGLTQSTPTPRKGYREQTDKSYYTAQFNSPAAVSPSQDWSQTVQKVNENSPTEAAVKTKQLRKDEIEDFSDEDFELPGELETLLDGRNTNTENPKATSPSQVKHADAERESGPKAEPGTKDMTSEEHNAWLLSDPRLRESSCANPDFLNKFYSTSRLHHLSTWKAELKSSMQRLAAEKGLAVKTFKSKPGSRRYILHVDFDSFFCAVSLKKNPEFIELPTVVAHGTGSGSEIASCNYVARKFGVKNGMWMKRALDLCPDIKVLPYDFPAYEEASRIFYESIMNIGGVVQSVSIDEALVDATAVVLNATGSQGMGIDEGSTWREQEKVNGIAQRLRDTIKEKTGCHVSVGIGGNILQAKVALRRAKPAGQFQLRPEDVLDVIGELTVEQLPGVAYSLSGKLEELGVKFVKDIRDISKERLVSALGPKTGERLAEYARGIDKTEVGVQPPRKSVSAEVNWGIRFISQAEAEEFVVNLCKELERRLLNEQVKGRHLTMKIMRRSLDAPLDPAKHLGHGRCDTFNKSATFGISTHNYETIGKEAVSILRSFKFSPGDLRGLGVQMTKLEPIKGNSATSESSQKKLTFAAFGGPGSAKKKAITDQIDDIESPTKPKSPRSFEAKDDPIADDPLTPRKPKHHPAMALAKAAEKDSKAQSPLNVSGTQFIMPSNADPRVIAELPNDIRSKLMNQKAKGSTSTSRSASPFTPVRSESPITADVLPSQVDAEVFNALPDDMKAEILSTYGRRPEQIAIHKSPSKRHLSPQKKQTTPTKRGGIKGLMNKAQRQRDAEAGVVQTNFMGMKKEQPGAIEVEIEELDPEFLAELPDGVSKEVIADRRRQKHAQRSGLDAPVRRQQNDLNDAFVGGQQRINFPTPPPKISFATSGATSTQEIKDLLSAWHTETRGDGPHRGDVEVLEKYLARVVEEERDMNKASTLVKWLNVLVNQGTPDGPGLVAWKQSLESVKEAVQEAAKRRGRAPLNI